MQLYKQRDLGQMFSDTFTFLKKNGKHFFKNYFQYIAIPTLIFVIVCYFFIKYYLMFVTYAVDDSLSGFTFIQFLILGILFLIVSYLFGIYNYSYCVIYFMLYSEYEKNFNLTDIRSNVLKKFKKIVIFTIAVFGLTILLFIPLILLITLLAVTIVGILLIPLVVSFMFLWYNSALIEYLSTTSSLGNSIRFGFKINKDNFWKSATTLSLFYLMLYLSVSIIVGIPSYIIMMVVMFSNIENNEFYQLENDTSFSSFMIIYYIVTILFQILSNLILQTNANIIHYSQVEDESNVSSIEEIEKIGSY